MGDSNQGWWLLKNYLCPQAIRHKEEQPDLVAEGLSKGTETAIGLGDALCPPGPQ